MANNRDFISDRHWDIYIGRDKNERGAELVLDENIQKYVLRYYHLSDRIIQVKLESKPLIISIIIVNAPMLKRMEEEIYKFNGIIDNTKIQCKLQAIIIIIMKGLNTKVGKERVK